ncbi:hypothetical protein [Bergeyella cardium]|nr:hypothetical protein [Bergeyella cardium]WHE34156.1 hypothetical protein P8603_02560 [Bergeyella cardium]WHF60807.1 hypothetical protein O0R51_02555 [Bergeyella cardium]
MNASLIYYMKINPDDLSDYEWACRVKELQYLRIKENDGNN